MILDACAPALAGIGIAPEDAPGDLDLRESGLVDSLGFVELIVDLEDKLGIEIDLEDLDPEQITILDPLATYIAEQTRARAGEPG